MTLLVPINTPIQIGQGFNSGGRVHSLGTHKTHPDVKIDDKTCVIHYMLHRGHYSRSKR